MTNMNDILSTTPECCDTRSHDDSSPTKLFLDESESIHEQRENRLWAIRQWLREPAAEFAGVMILVLFGAGVGCQVNLSANPSVASSPKGDPASFSFGWAAGLALGVWISAGISGGHINPAATLALFRGFPWRKVPGEYRNYVLSHLNLISILVYMVAQLLGGIVGAGLVYANYFHAIDIVEGGQGHRTLATAGIFSSFAADYETNGSAFFAEFLPTAILVITILAVTDKRNAPPPPGLLPLAIFIVMLGIAAALGMNTGFAMNPARDLGPRMLMAMVGYDNEIWNYRGQYWLWCPVIAPFLGAIVGTVFYDGLFFTGQESVIVRAISPKNPSFEDRIDEVV
ncbi:hypothetical protein VKT23_014006 [Stygiomarasmius scandens]|uniref:Aquaporin n=1 Tax=Marasmiellus scandens TaxID=2682957 RepID=A0ABR1J4J4_9AGAR